ncbi:hypothetical protein CWN49_31300 [Klebsiella michiganensis]|uniref:Uncharacterized protein n=1 Tax=Klebsiella michiganensis TaxID=1134687 RepID=A0A2J5P841_9ENTR|nr:hypothetical protein CWN49_31300 [Klebsiella michiganensis]
MLSMLLDHVVQTASWVRAVMSLQLITLQIKVVVMAPVHRAVLLVLLTLLFLALMVIQVSLLLRS